MTTTMASPPRERADGAPRPLWRHQAAALDFALPRHGAMLAMSMGTGKSRVVAELIQRRGHQRILVIAPKAVAAHVWNDQLRQWSVDPLVVLNLTGSGTAAKKAERLRSMQSAEGLPLHSWRPDDPLVVIVNYDICWRPTLLKELLRAGFDFLVLDECHRIKAPSGKASIACRNLARAIPWRIGLTGTPQPHSVVDWFAQCRALDPTVFGMSVTAYKAAYCGMKYPGSPKVYPLMQLAGVHRTGERIVLRPEREQEFHAKVASLAFRVDESVLDLPPVLDIERVFDLSPVARKAYDRLQTNMILWLKEGTVTPANALVLLLKLQQMTGGWLRDDSGTDHLLDTGKMEALQEILEDLPPDEPVVVFCKFRSDLDTVHRQASSAGRASSELSGRTNTLETWQPGGSSVLAVQIQAGSVGIDLTRAKYAVFYSTGFNAGDYWQARARLHRPGQRGTVTYFHLIAKNTVDVQVQAALAQKQDGAEAVLQHLLRGRP